MSLLKNLLSGSGGVIGKVTEIAEKAVTDKDQLNQLLFSIVPLLMQSQIAKWVRAVIGTIIVVSCLFFGDKLTIPPEVQSNLLYGVTGFYFLDFITGKFAKK